MRLGRGRIWSRHRVQFRRRYAHFRLIWWGAPATEHRAAAVLLVAIAVVRCVTTFTNHLFVLRRVDRGAAIRTNRVGHDFCFSL
jgi:hypothetical protein